MQKKGKKNTCEKCEGHFYERTKNQKLCHSCQKSELIPDGTNVLLSLSIVKGGHDEAKLGWTDGCATKGKTGAIYLNCKFSVLSSPHKGKSFTGLIGLRSPKGPWWGNKGREIIRGILESESDISSSDVSGAACKARRIKSLADLDGSVFEARLKTVKSQTGIWETQIDEVLPADVKEANNNGGINDEAAESSQGPKSTDAQSAPMWLN